VVVNLKRIPKIKYLTLAFVLFIIDLSLLYWDFYWREVNDEGLNAGSGSFSQGFGGA